MFARLERAFNKLKKNIEHISQSLSAQTRQKKLDARILADLKDTITDLRKQNALLQSDQHALPMLHQLLATLTAPDVVYMDNVIPTTFLYTVLASQCSTPGHDHKNNFLTLMRLCHPHRHPGIDRHISQQLIAVHNILTDSVTRKIYDCCGVRAVTRKNTTHFYPLGVTPALFTNPSMTFGIDLQPAMTQCSDAFFKEGCNITNTNRNISSSFYLRKGQFNISFRSFNFLSAHSFPGLPFCKA